MMQLSIEEEELVYELAEALIGVTQKGDHRKDILVSNVSHRVNSLRLDSLKDYLILVEGDENEYQNLISLLTIHTTSWFREKPHYDNLRASVIENINNYVKAPYIFLSSACSTGEEVYSAALVLEELRKLYPGFDYKVYGFDIDSVSVNTAIKGIYSIDNLSSIESKYHSFIKKGHGGAEAYFMLSDDIMRRVFLTNGSLLDAGDVFPKVKFDIIFCRNVLIYFSEEKITQIINTLKGELKDGASLTLGHCESIFDAQKFSLEFVSNSSYRVISTTSVARSKNSNKILVIDDSRTVREVLQSKLERAGYVVFSCADTTSADETLKRNLDINLITLDLKLDGEDGDIWLKRKRISGLKLPVVIVTGSSADDAEQVISTLEESAQGFFNKTEVNNNEEHLFSTIESLIEKSQSVAPKGICKTKRQKEFNPEIVVVGASTGGTEALVNLFKQFPKDGPPILIVQHIPATFAKAFAQRLSNSSGMNLGNMAHGSFLERGSIYIADDDYHIYIKKMGSKYKIMRSDKLEVNGHRPSVSVMFSSTYEFADKVGAIILTGMGKDGACETVELKKMSAMTFVQDEKSSVVFGMPREVIRLNGAGFVGNIDEIRNSLVATFKINKQNDSLNLRRNERGDLND